jgi:hypothetical protein
MTREEVWERHFSLHNDPRRKYAQMPLWTIQEPSPGQYRMRIGMHDILHSRHTETLEHIKVKHLGRFRCAVSACFRYVFKRRK